MIFRNTLIFTAFIITNVFASGTLLRKRNNMESSEELHQERDDVKTLHETYHTNIFDLSAGIDADDEDTEATRNLKSNTKSAFVFLRRDGANGLGHVGGAFELADGTFMCFATENYSAQAFVSWEEKGFWSQTANSREDVLQVFREKDYTNYKRLDVYYVDPDMAMEKMEEVSKMDYNVMYRNCQNDVYDVLHDEGSGYGITANAVFRNNGCYIGWVQEVIVGPNYWFDNKIGETEKGLLTDKCMVDIDCDSNEKCKDDKCVSWPRKKGEKCWGSDSDCDWGLSCCSGKCKSKVFGGSGWSWGWYCPAQSAESSMVQASFLITHPDPPSALALDEAEDGGAIAA